MVKIVTDPAVLADKEINFVDMHHHSNMSDGSKSPQEIARVFEKRRIGLCIADHNEIDGPIYLSKQTNVFTIPSIEITTKEQHDILAYFYTIKDLVSFYEKEIKTQKRYNAGFNYHRTTLSNLETLEKIKEYNGVSVLAHPMLPRLAGIFKNPKRASHLLQDKSFMKKLDGIESHNFVNGAHGKNTEYFKSLKKPMTAGSDSHHISPFNTLTGAYAHDIESFLQSILKRKNIIFFQNNCNLRRFAEKMLILKNDIHLRIPKTH